MPTFSTLPLSEARRQVLPPRRATQEQYREYVRQLGPESAGRLVLEDGDRPITERARLRAAAQAEGINLEIRRRDNTMVFWRTEEPPKPRGGGARGGARGRRGS